MAIALTVHSHSLDSNNFAGKGRISGEGNLGTYATGGVAVAFGDINTGVGTYDTANAVKSGRLTSLTDFQVDSGDVSGYKFAYDRSAGKVKAFSAGATELGAVDLSAKLFQWTAYGEWV